MREPEACAAREPDDGDGDKLSHEPPVNVEACADQLRVPPPVFMTVKVWSAGFDPTVAMKGVKLIGLISITGGFSVRVRVTDICLD